jgi:hypothetical protein
MMVFDLIVFDGRAVAEPEPVNPTGDPADIRVFVTTVRASVGCLPHSRHEDACRSRHAVEDCTTPGLRLFRCTGEHVLSCELHDHLSIGLRGSPTPGGQ